MTTLLGQKLGMTQMFAPDGAMVPVTLVHLPETFVTQLKTAEKDGYIAVQVGSRPFTDNKKAEKVLAKPQLGHLKKSEKLLRNFYEYRGDEQQIKDLKMGQPINLDVLKVGDIVQVRGTSKGRGFAGVVKRHHFAGGPASHGHKDNLRMPGSIGSQQPQHVMPGTRMGGHMGAEQVFVKRVEVVKVDSAKRLAAFKGPLPGSINGWLKISVTGTAAKNPISARTALEKSSTREKGKEAKKETGDKK